MQTNSGMLRYRRSTHRLGMEGRQGRVPAEGDELLVLHVLEGGEIESHERTGVLAAGGRRRVRTSLAISWVSLLMGSKTLNSSPRRWRSRINLRTEGEERRYVLEDGLVKHRHRWRV